ncbi:MAG: PilZ domain-containing protein [Candidatus Omnitrophota bacterium]|nr:PilZ domain-containing protein [Candidatus Omnitrophota bacterium]
MKIGRKAVLRIDKNSQQSFSLAKGNSLKVDMFDISVLGVGIRTKYFLPKGLIVHLEINGVLFGLAKPMKVKGEIRHCEQIDTYIYKCGVKFLNISKGHKDSISQLIATHERRTVPRLKLPE